MRTEVITIPQRLERLKRSEKTQQEKPSKKSHIFPASQMEPVCPEDNTMYQKYPTCICFAREHVQVRIFLQLRISSNHTMRPPHPGSRAWPAVRNKQACCDANGYGCAEGRRCVEDSKHCVADQNDGGGRSSETPQ